MDSFLRASKRPFGKRNVKHILSPSHWHNQDCLTRTFALPRHLYHPQHLCPGNRNEFRWWTLYSIGFRKSRIVLDTDMGSTWSFPWLVHFRTGESPQLRFPAGMQQLACLCDLVQERKPNAYMGPMVSHFGHGLVRHWNDRDTIWGYYPWVFTQSEVHRF